jgi:hypothetical protein
VFCRLAKRFIEKGVEVGFHASISCALRASDDRYRSAEGGNLWESVRYGLDMRVQPFTGCLSALPSPVRVTPGRAQGLMPSCHAR